MIIEDISECSHFTAMKSGKVEQSSGQVRKSIHSTSMNILSIARNQEQVQATENLRKIWTTLIKAQYFNIFKFHYTSKMKIGMPARCLDRLNASCQILKPEVDPKEAHNVLEN